MSVKASSSRGASAVQGDLAYRLAALEAVLRDREAELLELKGPCSNPRCLLHYAHSGPCNSPPKES